MERILITGACGQIGTELTYELRKRYGNDAVIATDIRTSPKAQVHQDGVYESLDCTDAKALERTITRYNIDTVYHLAAILSSKAEENPQKAWDININGLYNILEAARKHTLSVFTPSSIGAFGSSTPPVNTPQDTIQRPSTIYGVTKVSGELLCDYYHHKYSVDTRGIRYPGIISYKQLPGGGTTDYAIEIYYEAIRKKAYTSPLKKGTFLDMMYMPDAINAAVQLMEAQGSHLKHRNAFNVTAMSFDPQMLGNSIKEIMPDFKLDYKIDEGKQQIANSWPDSLDDSAAKQEWGWQPSYNLKTMTRDMLEKVAKKLAHTTI